MASGSETDYDSGVEVDDDRNNSYVAVLDRSSRKKVFDHNRCYPFRYRKRHPFPVDDEERERQFYQFYAFYDLFDGRLCPVSASAAQNVLDVRTGAGWWAIEFADHHPASTVRGMDMVYMQDELVPPNCEFRFDGLRADNWHSSFNEVDFVHVGALWGDRQLLASILHGAYSRCRSDGMLEIWDCNVHFQDPRGGTYLHIFYNEVDRAFQMDGRSLALPREYLSEMKSHGFTNVVDQVCHIPLNMSTIDMSTLDMSQLEPPELALVTWWQGVADYSVDLLIRNLGMDKQQVTVLRAGARQALQTGVDGWLEVRVTSGEMPKLPSQSIHP